MKTSPFYNKHVSKLTAVDDILRELHHKCDEMMWNGDYQDVDLKRILKQIDHYQAEHDKGVLYEPDF